MEFQTQHEAELEQTTPTQREGEEAESRTPEEKREGPENATSMQREAGSNEATVRSSVTEEEPAIMQHPNGEEEQEEEGQLEEEQEQQQEEQREEEEHKEENQPIHEELTDGATSRDAEADKLEQNINRSNAERPAPPTSLQLSAPTKKKVLVAPPLSLSLGGSGSLVSDDFPTGFLSPSPEDDTGLDFDLDAIETPSDSESLAFPFYDPDLEDDLQRLGVVSHRRQPSGSVCQSRSGSCPGTDHSGLGAMDREDVVDEDGTRWRCFSSGDPPQESRVNMSVLQPFLRVLSHGGYYGDGANDIIVFSSCYLPEGSMENYQYIMDHLFRFVVGTLDLMVSQNYVIVYLCAGGQKDKLPGIGWLRECYTTIARRLRKSLKGFYVVHPTWYIKALITITKPFISSKFTKKLQFIETLQDLSHFIPTEHVQIPDCVQEYDNNLSR